MDIIEQEQIQFVKLAFKCKAEFHETLSELEGIDKKHEYIINVLKDQQNFKVNNNAPFNFCISKLKNLKDFFNVTDSDKAKSKLWDYDISRKETIPIFNMNKATKNKFDFFKITNDFEMAKAHFKFFGYELPGGVTWFEAAKRKVGASHGHHILMHENDIYNPLCIIYLSNDKHNEIHNMFGKFGKKNPIILEFYEQIENTASDEEKRMIFVEFFKKWLNIDYEATLKAIYDEMKVIEAAKKGK